MDAQQFAKQFGHAVRARRRRMGLTQQQLAERLGINARTVLRIERGERDTSVLRRLAELAEALEMNVSTLAKEAEGGT